MTERRLRQFHATLGVVLSLFILVQVGSGTLLALTEFVGEGRHAHAGEPAESHHDEPGDHHGQDDKASRLQVIHHHGEPPVQALRVLLGIGILTMAASGMVIYFVALGRTRRSSRTGP